MSIWSSVARRCIWSVTGSSFDLSGWRSLLTCVVMAEMVGDPQDRERHHKLLLATERLVGLARVHSRSLVTKLFWVANIAAITG